MSSYESSYRNTEFIQSSNGEIISKRCRDFHNFKEGLAGKHGKCRWCRNEINKKYFQDNRE